MTHTTPAYDLTVRSFDVDVTDVPTYWFGDSAVQTHGVNAQNMMFPETERFFVRSVHRHLRHVDDPGLRAAVKAFIGQEAQHGRSHDQTIDLLRDQGFRVEGWVRGVKRTLTTFERFAPAWLCLSVTAAMEHFTARISAAALEDGRLEAAHPTMRTLLTWHAVEEIEHRSVAYDMLQIVAPSYAVRVLGLVIAMVYLLGVIAGGALMLLWQDPEVSWSSLQAGRREGRAETVRPTRFIERHALPYLAPGFHPDQDEDHGELVAEHLARVERFLAVRTRRAA